MSDIAIRCEGLSKQYRIGERESYKTVRDVLTDGFASPFRRLAQRAKSKGQGSNGSGNSTSPSALSPSPSNDLFWALKEVSFEVSRGEVVGIIGRNGAGKSTLLKILSRITKPTKGHAQIHGRVGSLLEVGTGFHPELTGRENIYLNAAILGMRKAEVAKKFDEIVAFAEVEKFIDTPVKRYSSGMYVRLAFAVAAHMDTEVLLVDEVLAVGDASFQKKCLGKMEEVGQVGRTIFFVSHNMHAISRLCPRTILLDDGRVIGDGPSHQVIGTYLKAGFGTSARREWPDAERAPGDDIVRLRAVRIRSDAGEVVETIDIRRAVAIEMEFDVLKPGHVLVPNFHFHNEEGINVFIVSDQDRTWQRRARLPGRYSSSVWIPGNFLAEGSLVVSAAISTVDPVVIHFWERDAVAFQVVDSLDGDSSRGDYAGPMPGVVRPLLEWSTKFEPRSQVFESEQIVQEVLK